MNFIGVILLGIFVQLALDRFFPWGIITWQWWLISFPLSVIICTVIIILVTHSVQNILEAKESDWKKKVEEIKELEDRCCQCSRTMEALDDLLKEV